MKEIELELTYLAKELPAGLADCPSKLIVDVYYPPSAEHPHLRLRQNGDKYQLTNKVITSGTDSSNMTEETVHLTPDQFKALVKAPGKRVAKRRYMLNYQGQVAEVDVFQEDLSGLVIIDFEFGSRQLQTAFKMPDFCLADITQDKLMAGGMLAGKSYANIAQHLTKYGYKPLYF